MKLIKEDKRIFYNLVFPALLEVIIIRLLHIADSVMLGQMQDSTLAVAAVGLCGAPINLIVSVTSAFFYGTTAAVAWYYGANEKKNMRTFAWQSMAVAAIVAVLFSVFSILGAGPIMKFICGSGETLTLATSYYRIYACGFFFQILTSNITAILRGIGITKIPLLYNITGGAINVILNYLLIYGKWGFPELRSDGAALATTISMIVSFIIAALILVFKKTDINFRLGLNKKIDSSIKTRLLPIGLTSAGEQLILQIGAIFTSKIIAVLPTSDIAANQIVANLEAFAWSTGAACQVASTSLFGRSLGENNQPKAKSFLSFAVKWTLGFAFAEMLVFCLFGKQLGMVFSNDSGIYGIITILLLISSLSLPFINVHQTVSGALRSAGDSIAPLIASFISLWVFRVLLGYLTISVLDMGIYAYKWCIVADQFVRCTIVCIFYLSGHWKKFILKYREPQSKN